MEGLKSPCNLKKKKAPQGSREAEASLAPNGPLQPPDPLPGLAHNTGLLSLLRLPVSICL